MDKLDIFQDISGKVDEFGWWDMERIQTDSGTQFTSKEFQAGLYVLGLPLALAALDHQEINGQVKLKFQKLKNIVHSIMV